MITRKTLYPGQAETKKWLKKFGQKLVCVRYKYDIQTKIKMIKVELIAEVQSWEKNVMNIPKE